MTSDTDSDTDIIIINKDEFLRLKITDKILDNPKLREILNNIVKNHECFSSNYKYMPHNDQNYKNKLSVYHKKTKKKFNIDENSKCVFSLLNKLSESNYALIEEKIVFKMKKVKDTKDFLKKILKYCETSNLYTILISNIFKQLYGKNKCDIENLYVDYQNNYMTTFNFSEYLEDFDYNNYDDFCSYIKNCNMQFNVLCCILEINNTIPDCLNIIQLFNHHYNLINDLQNLNSPNKDKYICEVYKHIEHYFKHTNIINILLCKKQSSERFINQCEFNKLTYDKNLKLKFKIDDILTLFIEKINNK